MKNDFSRESLHETVPHGKKNFPFAVYHGRIPEWLGDFPLHWHDEFEIIYVVYGSGVISVNGKRFPCAPCDIVLIPPGAVHSISRKGDSHLAYYNILFSLSLLEENPESLCSRKFLSDFSNNVHLKEYYLSSGSDMNALILPLVKSLSDLWEKDDTEYALLIKARIFEIMHNIRNQILDKKESELSRIQTERLKKIISFINLHFTERITVCDAAEVLNLSESRFMKVFREDTGTSFIKYLNDFRLESAAEQLIDGNFSVTEVAFQNGFENVSYFIRSFRKKFGCSPLKYKNGKT